LKEYYLGSIIYVNKGLTLIRIVGTLIDEVW